MLTVALIAFGLIPVAALVIWLTTPAPEVPIIDRDGFPSPTKAESTARFD
jgi:hypothetical protein